MAKKLPWGSFTHKDLVIDEQDDIYITFPYLELERMEMTPISELSSPNENTTRGTTGLITTRKQAIFASIKYGWDRTSWPIPYLPIKHIMGKEDKPIFDRRHTFSACQEVALRYNNIDDLPTARYKRVHNRNGGIVNLFSDTSIAMIASVYGNANGPVPENIKDHQFENVIVRILRNELKRGHTPEHELFTLDLCKQLFKEMGGHDRYDDQRTKTRIPNNAHSKLVDEDNVTGTNTTNNHFVKGHKDDDIDKFIRENDGWERPNTTTDTTHYSYYGISKVDWHTREVANRVIAKLIELERTAKENDEVPKLLKVMLFNDQQANQANMIVKSRNVFTTELNKSWYTRRDSVLEPVEGILNKDIIPRKLLSDFNVEIWVLEQLETEETHELTFDLGGWPPVE